MDSVPISGNEKPAKEPGSRRGITTMAFDNHAIDADEALQAFNGLGDEEMELDEATRKRLLHRIDLYMMPVRQCERLFICGALYAEQFRSYASSMVSIFLIVSSNDLPCRQSTDLQRDDTLLCQCDETERRYWSCRRRLSVAWKCILLWCATLMESIPSSVAVLILRRLSCLGDARFQTLAATPHCQVQRYLRNSVGRHSFVLRGCSELSWRSGFAILSGSARGKCDAGLRSNYISGIPPLIHSFVAPNKISSGILRANKRAASLFGLASMALLKYSGEPLPTESLGAMTYMDLHWHRGRSCSCLPAC